MSLVQDLDRIREQLVPTERSPQSFPKILKKGASLSELRCFAASPGPKARKYATAQERRAKACRFLMGTFAGLLRLLWSGTSTF